MRGAVVLGPTCGEFIGGFGLLLCVAICHRRLLSLEYIFGAQLVGAVSALAFSPWATLYEAHVGGGYLRFTSWFAILAYLHLAGTSEGMKLALWLRLRSGKRRLEPIYTSLSAILARRHGPRILRD